jgi:hypothetical protein
VTTSRGRPAAGHQAEGVRPEVRDSTDTHSPLVNTIVCVVFIILILA